jgi:signal transduction histidine kinase
MNTQIFSDLTTILPLRNLDLLSVGITVAIIVILGFIIYINNKKSATNRSFFFLACTSALWSIINYLSYNINVSGDIVIWFNRLILFSAVWFAFAVFQLAYVFPKDDVSFSKKFYYFVVPLAIIASAITLTPLVFSGVQMLTSAGQVSVLNVRSGIVVFGIAAFFFNVGAIILLHLKLRKATGIEKSQFRLILMGVYITLACILIFNFIFPAFLQIVRFIPLGALFIFPFLAFTAYAIYKHHLFNIRAVTVVGLTIILSIASFLEIVFSTDIVTVILRSAIFLLVLSVSILMNRFVQTIAEQGEQLQIANAGQENLMHIMNHQLKGRFGNTKNIFAELLMSDDYGKMPEDSKPLLQKGLQESQTGIDYVQGILKGSSASTGKLQYDMKQTDLRQLVIDLITKEKPLAEQRGLRFESDISNFEAHITGDSIQLGEALKNLIDNAIRYNSPEGNIKISLKKETSHFVFSVQDTGVGISKDDELKLYTPGGRGKDSIKYNADSTGYGLAFVKDVIEKHKGKIYHISNAPAQGTTFIVELPLI